MPTTVPTSAPTSAPTTTAIETEIDQNFEVFREKVAGLISANKRGQHALMRNREIVELFDSAGAAYRAGKARYSDQLFSIQEVTDKPMDLGYFSYGGAYTDV